MRRVEQFFAVYLGLLGLSAVMGGYGLITSNGLGMPLAWLAKTPFDSFVIPGLILLIIVGGTHLLASILVWREHHLALEAAATAGFGLLIWITTELYWLPENSLLHILYFCFGLATIISVLLIQQYKISHHVTHR